MKNNHQLEKQTQTAENLMGWFFSPHQTRACSMQRDSVLTLSEFPCFLGPKMARAVFHLGVVKVFFVATNLPCSKKNVPSRKCIIFNFLLAVYSWWFVEYRGIWIMATYCHMIMGLPVENGFLPRRWMLPWGFVSIGFTKIPLKHGSHLKEEGYLEDHTS